MGGSLKHPSKPTAMMAVQLSAPPIRSKKEEESGSRDERGLIIIDPLESEDVWGVPDGGCNSS